MGARLAKAAPPPTGKEIRITVKLRNNRLIEAREARGWTQGQAASELGVIAHTISNYETLSLSPVSTGYSGRYRTHAGDWKQSALKIAHGYGKPASHFWPESTLSIATETERVLSTDALTLVGSDAPALESVLSEHPEDVLLRSEDASRLVSTLKTLTPREERVLRLRFGIECDAHTLDEVADDYGVSRERVRQLEQKALRKLRHPARTLQIRPDIGSHDGDSDVAREVHRHAAANLSEASKRAHDRAVLAYGWRICRRHDKCPLNNGHTGLCEANSATRSVRLAMRTAAMVKLPSYTRDAIRRLAES